MGQASLAQENCEDKYPYCTNDSNYFYNAPINQAPGSPNANYGCMLTQDNPTYFLMQITQSGSLAVAIQGTNMASQSPGFDVDFVCWGPFNQIYPQCDSLNAAHIVDCGYSASSSETLNISNALVGEFYVFVVTNASNQQQEIKHSKIGGLAESIFSNCLPPGNPLEICAGMRTNLIIENPNNLTNVSYSIQPGGAVSSVNIFSVAPIVTTSYTTYITGLNSQNVLTTNTAIITVTAQPWVAISPTITQSKCTNSVNFVDLGTYVYPSNSAITYSVFWNPMPISVLNSSQTTASTLSPGIYQVSVWSHAPSANIWCGIGMNFVIDGLPVPPTFTLRPDGPDFTINCTNTTFTIGASDPTLNYQWSSLTSTSLSGQNITFNSLQAGTWTISGKDPVTECIFERTIHIVNDFAAPNSTLLPIFQLITCSNSAVQTVSATSNPSINIEHQFFWQNGLSVQGIYSNLAIVSPPPGTHTYVLINRANGCKSTKTFTVGTTTGFPTFTLSSPIQNYSIGCVPKHTVDINIVGGNTDPPGGQVTYTILPPGFLGTYTTGPASAYVYNAPGMYTVITRDEVSFCETKCPFSVIQNTLLPETNVSLLTQTLSCFTPSLWITGSTNVLDAGYQWFYPGGAGVLPGAFFYVATTSNPGNTLIATYTFAVTDNNNACKAETLVPMFQNIFPPIPKISPPSGNSAAISCKNPTLVLTNSSYSGIPPGLFTSGGLVIAEQWNGPGLQPKVLNNSTYIVEEPGTYSLTVRDMNNGCLASTVFPVGDNRDYPVINNPIAPANASLDCGEAVATVSAYITGTVPVKYVWFNNLGVIKTATLSSGNGTVTAPVSSTGDYLIQVTDENNGCISWADAHVVKGELYASFIASDTSGFAPLTVTFTNTSFSSLGSSGITSYWSFGNGNSQTITPNLNATAFINQTYNQPGHYTVTVFTEKGQCRDVEEHYIEVELPSKLEIPNVFTPNGDGNNDLFFLHTASLDHLEISIYDRWGNLVYSVESSTGNIEWDGKTQAGLEAAAGAYFLVVNASGRDGKKYDTKSTLSLFR